MGALLGVLQVAANVGLFAAVAWLVFAIPQVSTEFWVLVGGLLAVKAVLVVVGRALVPEWSATERKGLRSQLFLALVDRFRKPAPPDRGEALHLMTEGVDSLELYRGLFFPQLLTGAVAPLIVTGLVALVDPWSALFLLVFAPITPLLVNLLRKAFQSSTTRYYQETAALTSRFQEGILGLETLSLFGVAESYGQAVAADSQRHRRAAMGLMVVNQLLLLFMDLFSSLGSTVVAVVVASVRFQQGVLEPWAALFLVLVSVELNRPLQLMGAFFFAGTLGRNSLKKSKAILSEVSAPGPISPPPKDPRELRLESVRYQYPDSERPVGPVSFTLRRGQLLGLAGPSGGGKTTLKRLAGGLLVPTAGTIFVDDSPADASVLSEIVGATDQSPVLWEGSLADNLRLASPRATRGEIQDVLERVGLADLSQTLGEEGHGLSGGQKARLALARALVRPTPFLILDEPSADLDLDTESLVLAVARQETARRGVLVISHRPAALEACDAVISCQEDLL